MIVVRFGARGGNDAPDIPPVPAWRNPVLAPSNPLPSGNADHPLAWAGPLPPSSGSAQQPTPIAVKLMNRPSEENLP
jgi:hypothetical protein